MSEFEAICREFEKALISREVQRRGEGKQGSWKMALRLWEQFEYVSHVPPGAIFAVFLDLQDWLAFKKVAEGKGRSVFSEVCNPRIGSTEFPRVCVLSRFHAGKHRSIVVDQYPAEIDALLCLRDSERVLGIHEECEVSYMERRYISLSKRMSLALRHDPGKFGLALDEEGWAILSEFYKAMKMTPDDLEYIQLHNDKKRFEVEKSPVYSRIRAYYGYSKVDVKHQEVQPPDALYHGTPPKFAGKIKKDGIKSMSWKVVHHSADIETARVVGKRRHPRPVIFRVKAKEAHEAGIKFYLGNEDIWMSDEIPPEYLEVVEEGGDL